MIREAILWKIVGANFFAAIACAHLILPVGSDCVRLFFLSELGGATRPFGDSYESLQEKGIVLAGSPDTMIKKIRYLHDRCGIGHLLMMNQAGFMPTDKVRRSLELFAKEVYPAIREL